MVFYKITWDINSEIIPMEEPTSDYRALVDMLIDRIEYEYGRGSGQFLWYDETKEGGGEIEEDEYITGGNHGLILYTAGNFNITTVDPAEVYYCSYEETDKAKAGEDDTRSVIEWKEWYEQYGDKEEYRDFDEWLLDMWRTHILIPSEKPLY